MTLAPLAWDESVFSRVNSLGMERFDYFCGWPTYLGDPFILAFVAAIFILIWDEEDVFRKIAASSAAVFTAFAVARLFKHLLYRPRPYVHYRELIETGRYKLNALFELLMNESSFPSGHTAAVFALAAVLVCMYGRRFAGFYLLAAFIGFTRIYVGVHFPSDVLAGAVIGILTGCLSWRFLKGRSLGVPKP